MSTVPKFNAASRFQYFTSNGDCDYDGIQVPNEQKALRIDRILQNKVGELADPNGTMVSVYQDTEMPTTSNGLPIFYTGGGTVRYERCLFGLIQLDTLPEEQSDCPCFCTQCFNNKERFSMAVNNQSMNGLHDCGCKCGGNCTCKQEVLNDNLGGIDTGTLVAVSAGAILGGVICYAINGNLNQAVPYVIGGVIAGAVVA